LVGASRTPTAFAFAQIFAALLHLFRREFDPARERAEAAIEFAIEHRLPQWLAEATICRGFALVGLGQQAEGIRQLRSGLAEWNATGCRLWDTQWLGFTAEAYAHAGQFDEALAAWIERPIPPRRPESATIKRSCTG
jgi:predicted ATPase